LLSKLGNCSPQTINKKINYYNLEEFYNNLKLIHIQNKKCIVCGDVKNLQNINNSWYCGKHACQIKRNGKIHKRTRFDPPHIIEYPEKGIAEIVIYNKKEQEITRAIIDIDDVEIVSKYKWYLKDGKYIRTHINTNGKDYKTGIHRILMNVVENKNVVIDHIDRNPLNNKRENLRITTQAKNSINKSIQSNNTSGVTGVVWNSANRNWNAQIKLNRKNINLGVYKNFDDAVKARQDGELKYFGEFNPINRYEKFNTHRS